MQLSPGGRGHTTMDTGIEYELLFCLGKGAPSECILHSEGEGLGKVNMSFPLSTLDS